MSEHEHDYDLSKKIKITFQGMDYFVMPRYREHYLNHDYEKFSLQILKNNLAKTSLFVDVGAHYGAYSLYAAKESQSEIIAMEPVKENFQLLNENIKANKLGTLIKTYNSAASDKAGEAEFNIPWASDSAGFYDHPNAETIRKQTVDMRTVDQVVGSKQVNLMKIDTEGHELKVLEGMEKTLKANPQMQLIVELNPPILKTAGSSAEELLNTIKGLGKEIYMVDEDGFTLHRITDRLDHWPRYINEGNYANLYCVPAKGHHYLLFVSHSSQLGGAEMTMLEQITELRKKNILAHVVLPESGPLQDLLIEKGIGYSIVEGYSFWISQGGSPEVARHRNFNNMNAAFDIASIVDEINPTAIVNSTVVNPWGYPAARAAGLPLIWMVHEYGDLDHGLTFAHGAKTTRDFIVDNAELIITCSDAVKKSLPASNKVHTVRYSMRPERITKLSQVPTPSPYSTGKTIKLCLVGSISEGKQQTLLVEAVAALKERGRKVEVIFLGTGNPDYEKRLKQKIKTLNLENDVKLLGFVRNPYPYIKASDALVVASRNEAFGRVTAEAMVLGVPVIASDVGGSLEMIDNGKTGFLFKSLDVADLADTLDKFIGTPKDRLDQITKHAAAAIKKLMDTDRNTDQLAKLIVATALQPQAAADKKPMTTEWLDSLRFYREKLEQQEAKSRQLLEQAKGQEKINLELAKTLGSIQASQSYRTGLKLASIKNRLKGSKK
jgi:FkbM family methyltransferase